VWLRWSFMFGRDPVVPRWRLSEGRKRDISYATVPEVGLCMALPRNPGDPGQKRTSSSGVLDPGVLKQFAELWGFLTSTTFPDGGKRRTGRMSFSVDAGELVLSLNDPQTNQYATLQADGLNELLELAELKMASDEIKWRKSKFGK